MQMRTYLMLTQRFEKKTRLCPNRLWRAALYIVVFQVLKQCSSVLDALFYFSRHAENKVLVFCVTITPARYSFQQDENSEKNLNKKKEQERIHALQSM